jgi:AraC-like DNA-binding protein
MGVLAHFDLFSNTFRSMKDLNQLPQPYYLPKNMGQAILVHHYRGDPDFFFHYHPEYELTLIVGTAGHRLVGDCIAEYGACDLTLLGPGLAHTWATEITTEGVERGDNYVIHFTRESLGLDFLSRDEMSEVRNLLELSSRGLSFRGPGIDEAVERMKQISTLPPGRRLIEFLVLLESLASRIASQELVSAKYDPSAIECNYVILAELLEFIHKNSHRPISLSEAAHHARMSVPSFTRFFKKATGRSLVDYLNEWRISRACALLTKSNHSILKISQTTGFENLSHFNRQFLHRRGTTPRKFRIGSRE